MTRTRKPGLSRRSTLALMGAGAATFAAPWVARADANVLRIGMQSILSGPIALLGTSSRNALMMEQDIGHRSRERQIPFLEHEPAATVTDQCAGNAGHKREQDRKAEQH